MKLRKKIAYVFILISLAFFSYASGRVFRIDKEVKENSNIISKNTYIEEYNISKIAITDLSDELSNIEEDVTKNEISLIINSEEHKYKLSEIGIKINKKDLEKQIIEYHEKSDYHDSYNSITKNEYEKKVFEYSYEIDEEILTNFIEELAKKVKVVPKKGSLVMGEDRVLRYLNEIVGFDLSKEESINLIKANFENKDFSTNISLPGVSSYEEDTNKLINTKISSFTTRFDPSVSRRTNIEVGAKFIDGLIVPPTGVFSFYEAAGPFTRREYVYYLGVIGNGVCQVASTLYNAQLLAGLQTVTRYNHGTKSTYVEGGLDATVASGIDFVTDYKFRNNHSYPIYISAYTNNGTITIDIWSNQNATNGITYKTESVKIGYLSYSAYRHGYKDGVLVSTEHLGNSYYVQ